MIRRSDITVKDSLGTPEPGIYITVKDADGNLATLFDDDGSPMGNPIVSGTDGVFYYNVADDAAGAFFEEYRLSLSGSPRKVLAVGLAFDVTAFIVEAQNEIADDAEQMAGYVEDVSQQIAAATAIVSAIGAAPTSGLSLTASSRSTMAQLARDRNVIFDGNIWTYDTSNLTTKVAADAAAQGIYVPPDATTGLAIDGSAGAWVRQFSGCANPRWWGWTPGGTASANNAAIAAMKATLAAAAYVEAGLYQAVNPVKLPLGKTDISTTIDLDLGSVIFEGLSTGASGPNATILNAVGCTAIRTQRTNTSGATGAAGSSHTFSDGSIVRQFSIFGDYSGTEAENHAVHLRARATVENISASTLSGDGIHWDATSGGNPEGNVNSAIVRDVRLYNCRDLISTKGADGNACWFQNLDLASGRRWNINEQSFLGNAYVGFAVADGGIVQNSPATQVSQSGNRYGVIWRSDGDYTGASTNAPSGSTADSTYWYYIGPGGANTFVNIPLWASGMSCRAGGAILCKGANNRSGFMWGYFESGQSLPQIDAPAFAFGGILAEVRNVGTGAFVSFTNGGLNCQNYVGKRLTEITTGQPIAYTVGDRGNPLLVHNVIHPVYAPLGWRWELGVGGFKPNDYWLSYGGGNAPLRFTGPATDETFGGASIMPGYVELRRVAIGASGRTVDSGPTAPSGTTTRGQWRINTAPTASGAGSNFGWKVPTANGTTGIPFGGTAATVAAPIGGTTVDTEGRAATAAIITALQAAGLMA